MKYSFCLLVTFFCLCCNNPGNPSASENSNQQVYDGLKNENKNKIYVRDLLGINAFEWDFLLNPNNTNLIYEIFEPKMDLIKSFTWVRHYLDWEKLEQTKGSYTFNPTRSGGWDFDLIYERCAKENIKVLACIKTIPEWLQATYPEGERDYENVPAPYNSNRLSPASYIDQAKVAFQFAARYGKNKNIDSALLSVNSKQRWTGDPINRIKIGLNLIGYIECDNERDKWWKGKKALQTAEEYAANMSAFYDGHKGTLGKNVGVKRADPSMQVVMGGLSNPDPKFVSRMIAWCKKNRGYKKDGTVNLCFDVINYHLYSNDAHAKKAESSEYGIAPELPGTPEIARSFVEVAQKEANGIEVWVTEAGYDINQKSIVRVRPVAKKSILETQADWIIRTSFLYARNGVSKVFYYMLGDVNVNNSVQYQSSGLVDGLKRRPSADYIMQVKNLMADFYYEKTINQDPVVDVYKSGKRTIYFLVIPDEVDRKNMFTLGLGNNKTVNIHSLKIGADRMLTKPATLKDGKLTLEVTEKPVFIEVF